MKFESSTIKDIAKALNLSTSTVSRALRNSYEISEETKRNVLEYAEKINYRPNPIALSLKSRHTRAIGVVVSEIANNFFSQAINGIESIAYNRGYHVIITQTHESNVREQENVQHLASRGVDGLLISLSSQTADVSYLQDLHEKGLPIVFFDRITSEVDTHTVTANNYKGAFTATEHLIEQGFRSIAHITSSKYLSITNDRLAGYKAALEKYKLPFDETLVKYCPHGGMIATEVEDALTELRNGHPKPDAYFAAGDRLSIVCYGMLQANKTVHEAGYIGFSNSQVAHLFSPAMTTIHQPASEIGQAAIELLIQIIDSKHPVKEFEHKVLATELVVRQSSQNRHVVAPHE